MTITTKVKVEPTPDFTIVRNGRIVAYVRQEGLVKDRESRTNKERWFQFQTDALFQPIFYGSVLTAVNATELQVLEAFKEKQP